MILWKWLIQIFKRKPVQPVFEKYINDGTISQCVVDFCQCVLDQSHQAKQFLQMHKSAVEGTVKELAQRYNVSIAEIRKRKKEGTLSELN